METAVAEVNKGTGRVVNGRFDVMCARYQFDADFCNRASGQQKGVVEKNIQDSRRRILLDVRNLATYPGSLRPNGEASAWTDLMSKGATSTESSNWSIEHLPQAETTDRAIRSVSHQVSGAKFPVHGDLSGIDVTASKVDQPRVKKLANLSFTDSLDKVKVNNQ